MSSPLVSSVKPDTAVDAADVFEPIVGVAGVTGIVARITAATVVAAGFATVVFIAAPIRRDHGLAVVRLQNPGACN